MWQLLIIIIITTTFYNFFFFFFVFNVYAFNISSVVKIKEDGKEQKEQNGYSDYENIIIPLPFALLSLTKKKKKQKRKESQIKLNQQKAN